MDIEKLKNGYQTTAMVLLLIFSLSLFPVVFVVVSSFFESINNDFPFAPKLGFGIWVLSGFFSFLFGLLFFTYKSKAKLFQEIADGKHIYSYSISGKAWESYRDEHLLDGSKARIYLAIGVVILILIVGIVIFLLSDETNELIPFFGILSAVSLVILLAAYLTYRMENAKFNTDSGIIVISSKAIIVNNFMTIIKKGAMAANLLNARTTFSKGVNYLKIKYEYKMYRNSGTNRMIKDEVWIPFEKEEIEKFKEIAFTLNDNKVESDFLDFENENANISDQKKSLISGYIIVLVTSLLMQSAIANQLVSDAYETYQQDYERYFMKRE